MHGDSGDGRNGKHATGRGRGGYPHARASAAAPAEGAVHTAAGVHDSLHAAVGTALRRRRSARHLSAREQDLRVPAHDVRCELKAHVPLERHLGDVARGCAHARHPRVRAHVREGREKVASRSARPADHSLNEPMTSARTEVRRARRRSQMSYTGRAPGLAGQWPFDARGT